LTFTNEGKRREKTVGLRGIDVVSDAENIKKLLKMPYSSKAPVSMIVHRIGQSILIDDMDIHRLSGLLNMSDSAYSKNSDEWSWLKNFFYEIMLTSYESKEKALVRRNTTRTAIQERNLISKFLHRSLENKAEDSSFTIKQSPSRQSILSLSMPPLSPNITLEGNRNSVKEAKEVDSSLDHRNDVSDTSIQLPPLPEPTCDDLSILSGMKKIHPSRATADGESCSKDFARTLLWNFEDIRMLIGSDMPIFGDKEHPSVSLRLHNAKKPIHILTGLDYWLDNLMCQVPEVLMCFHVDGIVQKYELYKTEDLPALSEDGTFSPGIIRDVAQNILSFLKMNAAKEGHTYWLFKGKDDDIVKLYDLTGLCEEYDKSGGSSVPNADKSSKFEESKSTSSKDENASDLSNEPIQNDTSTQKDPFRTAVSLLLYKVARNILQNTDNRSGDEASVKRVLTNCLQLLDKNQYPQIATSAHFMLSDLYVPDDIDPANPNEKFATVTSNDRGNTEKLDSSSNSSKKNAEASSSFTIQPASIDLKTIRNNCPKHQKKQNRNRKYSKHNIYTKKSGMSDNDEIGDQFVNTDDLLFEDDILFRSPPITTCVVERCREALVHAAQGLLSLKNLERRRNEDKLKEDKAREKYERDNPRMSRPNEAIPMGYSNQESKLLVTKNRSRCHSESAATYISKSPEMKVNSSLSWHDHLKTVLFKKATIIYVVLAETHFVAQSYGQALKCVKRSLNCYEMVCVLTGIPSPFVNNSLQNSKLALATIRELENHVSSFMSFAFGLAGDSYYNIIQNWSDGVVAYQEEFNAENEMFDETIMEIIESHVDEARRNWSIKVPKDIEEGMQLANKCYDTALLLCEGRQDKHTVVKKSFEPLEDSINEQDSYEYSTFSPRFTGTLTEEVKGLINRRGILSNEMGVFYVNQAETLAKSDNLAFNDTIPEAVVKILNVSTSHLTSGLKDFKSLSDIPNQALIMANSGRHCRLFAYCYSLVETENKSIEIEMFRNENEKYKEATQLYDGALKLLTSNAASVGGFGKGKKNQYSKIHESVSWDLQTTYFIWGTRLQDATPKEAISMEEAEKLVIDLYNRALRLCDIETPGPRQPVFQYRAASIHMKLGSLYHLKYRNDEDNSSGRQSNHNIEEHRRKNLKQLAENHYIKAVTMFKDLEHGHEFLRAQTERIYLYESDISQDKSGVQGFNNFSKKTYHLIFELFSDCLPILKVIEDIEKLPTPANKNMIDTDNNSDTNQKFDEEEIHIYAILIKKIQSNLLDLSKLLSSKNASSKNINKTNELLKITKKLYLKSILLNTKNSSFLSELIDLLEIIKTGMLKLLR